MVWLLCIAEILCCHEGFVFYRFQVCGRPLAAGVGKLEALLRPGPGPAGTPRPKRCAGSWHGLSQGRPGGASPAGRPLTAAAGSGLAPGRPGRAGPARLTVTGCQAEWSPLAVRPASQPPSQVQVPSQASSWRQLQVQVEAQPEPDSADSLAS